jgi:light-regulated signal transduction histidine kinase (bacteriophytochrome)
MAAFIVDSALRMSALIDGLLSFASTGMAEEPRSVEVQDAVAKSKLNLALELEASGAVLTAGPLPVVQSNEIVLVRLFQNLISNAVKYRSERPVEIHISAEARGNDWVVSVRDNGIGIPSEEHTHVFLPFSA